MIGNEALLGTLARLDTDYTTTRAGYIDLLNGLVASRLDTTISSRASSTALATVDTNVDTLIARLTAARATNLDNLNATISSRLSTAVRYETSGYADSTPASTGSGMDLRYIDLTVSGITSYTKCIVTGVFGGGNTQSFDVTMAKSGSTASYLAWGRLTSNTNLRVSSASSLANYISALFTIVEFY